MGAKTIPLLLTIAVGLVVWFIPPFGGMDPRAIHLLAIFIATIFGIISQVMPMGAVAMVGMFALAATGTLSIGDTLSGFSNSTIWLIGVAFFVSRGFIKSGLGRRIAFHFVRMLGKRSLGLAYGLSATDLVLASAIPSNTARAGGVVFPIMRALAHAYDSDPEKGTARKIGSYLSITAFNATNITGAIFFTGMVGNPLAAKFAAAQNIQITWTTWTLAACVPGLVSLLVMPLVFYWVYPPEMKSTPAAPELARKELAAMGPMGRSEWILLGVFVLMLALWILGEDIVRMDATTVALGGLALLLLSGVLTWNDILKETGAWDTIIWFASLVVMGTFLNKLGFIPWFAKAVAGEMSGWPWVWAFLGLTVVYFYSHYLFASNTVHISSMYAAFLGVLVTLGAPPLISALVLGYFSNLFSSMTHYGTGPAPVYFGAGFVPLRTWWLLGFLISVINIAIWFGVGWPWWKALGLV
jgi:divalent anion:Na+ symporter, DASS family